MSSFNIVRKIEDLVSRSPQHSQQNMASLKDSYDFIVVGGMLESTMELAFRTLTSLKEALLALQLLADLQRIRMSLSSWSKQVLGETFHANQIQHH